MFEFLFILAVIFIAYITFNQNKNDDGQNPHSKEQVESILTPPGNKTVKVEITSTKPVPAKKTQPVTPKPKAKATRQAAPKIELRTVIMRNPATWEEAKVAGNYRMAKRWIKEALVEEGLLEKIYKNNELDDAAKVLVAEALSIIKAMDKYKA
ncbi:hypothetical protein BJAS_P1703 [Bathymodiolus japonicus methanotrophic gill symbiont]|uniref:hypothetical protein n=1 Tax=Bathymodiolus japonicus methanotrophic gill symbiont TaxID=113269 RepID=UPI001B523CD4|nr:hypothetical protein [Bathymodiolus japonicus methanotrophic gill symbiont]GFO71900.1 hypothetical protein BJAS_P1703 [Bathymodiolus japonicus methanotrophic gill symbiont]